MATKIDEHYSFPTPFYPVPSPLISIPPALAAEIPQIQADFAPETDELKMIRLERRAAVKDAFLVSWNTYKNHALPHDELRPVTLAHKDPFGGWGATLVDALDTLWIMGLKKDFDEAVQLVAKIDFTTNKMRKMKVFETVIRYLGGLLGAWDLATEGGQGKAYKNGDKEGYKVLLDQAKNLADILLGAFDTPNRMPILSWGWRLEDLEQHPRADTRSVAAELGTLSLEFTRLAQITGNTTYYDAVARITNALEEFQMNTTLPGLWPIYIDASGCKRIRKLPLPSATTTTATTSAAKTQPAAGVVEKTDLKVPGVVGGTGKEVTPANVPAKRPAGSSHGSEEVSIQVPAVVGGTGQEAHRHEKRDGDRNIVSHPPPLKVPPLEPPSKAPPKPQGGAVTDPNAQLKPQGGEPATDHFHKLPPKLKTPPKKKKEERCESQGLAAPHLIREEKYGLGAMIDSLYEYLLKQYLLLGGNEQYKRMYSKFADVARTELTFRPNVPGNPDILLAGNVYVSRAGSKRRFEPESSHLACFAGGMFAMGGRVLDRAQDLEIGDKLTAGCAWSYGSMRSGIMPESFKVSMCKDKKDCKFGRDQWVETIMLAEGFADDPTTTEHTSPEAAAVAGKQGFKSKPAHKGSYTSDDDTPHVHRPEKRAPLPKFEIKTAKELTEELIETDDIPEGFIRLTDKRYILRPEAIESVWYMYRISGDIRWANKGWQMWKSVARGVTVRFEDGEDGAASAIADVNIDPNSEEWVWTNSMESFWFGETLKYYYLLFSTPDVISLDEYVLNTEAHPFRRYDFGKRGGNKSA
ncbi:seven-hairpin glycosidase [Wilcoxina mikolae CBS 423.85]|nr:seven-hairpin glycosidase [Wilcoxina mikolae CBS 423.85]